MIVKGKKTSMHCAAVRKDSERARRWQTSRTSAVVEHRLWWVSGNIRLQYAWFFHKTNISSHNRQNIFPFIVGLLVNMSTRAAGNTYLPFVDLMRLETIDEVTFRSKAQPFCPGGTHIRSAGRAYGGHVYAQAAWAAAQTVPEGFVLHVSCPKIQRPYDQCVARFT